MSSFEQYSYKIGSSSEEYVRKDYFTFIQEFEDKETKKKIEAKKKTIENNKSIAVCILIILI
jgi:hypothetical protein